MPNFIDDNWYDENRNADVRGDEIGGIPVAVQENGESVDQDDYGGPDKSHPGAVGLEKAFPGQCVATDSLRLESRVESKIAE